MLEGVRVCQVIASYVMPLFVPAQAQGSRILSMATASGKSLRGLLSSGVQCSPLQLIKPFFDMTCVSSTPASPTGCSALHLLKFLSNFNHVVVVGVRNCFWKSLGGDGMLNLISS